MYFEMAPNYDSYVALDKTTDPVFKQQQTHIHWAFSVLDRRRTEKNCVLFNQATDGAIQFPAWHNLTDQWTVQRSPYRNYANVSFHRPNRRSG